jgi:hypothetical protein
MHRLQGIISDGSEGPRQDQQDQIDTNAEPQ